MVCKKVNVKIDHNINKKEQFSNWRLEKDIAVLRKDLGRQWKNQQCKVEMKPEKDVK